ncbi:uncharacterized protein [Mytilus edulis]|uniref:uncharacterized protein n=1 Tax=Mytilus edulis TaxID=6550 RepID=UPI0039EF84A4
MENMETYPDYKSGDLSWTGSDFKTRRGIEYLVNTIGTETEIRTRQRIFKIKDNIENMIDPDISCVTSGSLAEGLDLQGSDLDLMQIIKIIDVIEHERDSKYEYERTTLITETDTGYPGFVKLRLIAQKGQESLYLKSDCFETTSKGRYLSTIKFLDNIINNGRNLYLSKHGPGVSNRQNTLDMVFCFRLKKLSCYATEWSSRPRKKWPSINLIEIIAKNECLVVPKGPNEVSDCKFFWRISTSLAEKLLVHSFTFPQILCYGLLKLTLQRIISTHANVKGLLCSYFLKTAMFWVSEEVDIETFELSNLLHCFYLCFEKLKSWVIFCNCPNYFIPENNMFLGKINKSNNKALLRILESIKFNKIEELIDYALHSSNGNCGPFGKHTDISLMMVDLLFYRLNRTPFVRNISQCNKVLEFIESLQESESSAYIKDVCKFYHAKLSQNAAQLLPAIIKSCKFYELYHKHLENGTATDAVSGPLLCASFYYVTGQYDQTLKIVADILSKNTDDMIYLGCHEYDQNHVEQYSRNVNSAMTLNERMKEATKAKVWFLKHSPLIPKELQYLVENRDNFILPITLCHWLQYFCYFHLGNKRKKWQAFSNLYLKGRQEYSFYNTKIADADQNQDFF